MKLLDGSIWSEAYDLSVPLQVPMNDGELSVCNEVVRAMPGRRYVCRGVYDNKPVFIKLFSMSAQAKREWQKEQQGIEALHAAGIAAPTIIYSESSPDLSSHITIFNELLGAESARYRWEQSDQTARQILMTQLVELIAAHHAAGIKHKDCHLLNFIFSEDVLYTLDAADIVKSSELSRKESIDGLTDLLALFDEKYDVLLSSLYAHYWQCRDDAGSELEFKELQKKVIKLRNYKLQKYLKKIYRNCSEFIAAHSWFQFSVYRRDIDGSNFQKIISKPNVKLLNSKYSIIKNGNTCTVSLIETPDNVLICKRYNIKSFWHGLMRAFRVSRASHSWRNGYCLKRLNVNTPMPLCLIEQRFGPIRRRAWLFLEFIDGLSARDFFAKENNEILQKNIANQFVALFEKMLKNKLTHGDMKSTNFIIQNEKLFVIDLDSMQQHKLGANFSDAFRIDMARFMRNWSEFPATSALFVEQCSKSPVAAYLPDNIKS